MSIKRRICNVCGEDFVHDATDSHNTVEASVQVNTPFLRKNPGPTDNYCWFVHFKISTNHSIVDICDECAIKQIKKAAKKLHKRDVH